MKNLSVDELLKIANDEDADSNRIMALEELLNITDQQRWAVHKLIELAGHGGLQYQKQYKEDAFRVLTEEMYQGGRLGALVVNTSGDIVVYAENEESRTAVDLLVDAFYQGGEIGKLAEAIISSKVKKAETMDILGRLRDEIAVEPLIKALGENNIEWYVRRGATRALIRMKERAIEPLVNALKGDRYSYVVNEAAIALGWIGDERAIQPLVDAAPSVGLPAQDAIQAIVRRDKRALESLIRLSENADKDVRDLIGQVLGSINTKIIESLIKALEDTNLYVRRTAVSASWGITDERVLDLLIKMSEEEVDVDTRSIAVSVLSSMGTERAIGAVIKAMGDDNDYVRHKAAFSLWPRAGKAAVVPLIQALGHPNQHVRENAAYALGKMKDERAIEPLIKAALDNKTGEKVVTALGEFGASAAHVLLKNLGQESDGRIQGLYLSVLASVYQQNSGLIEDGRLSANYPDIQEFVKTARVLLQRDFYEIIGTPLLAGLNNEQIKVLTQDLLSWKDHQSNLRDLVQLIRLDQEGNWRNRGFKFELLAGLARDAIASGVPNYINSMGALLAIPNINLEENKTFRDFVVNAGVDLNVRMNMIDNYLEMLAVQDLMLADQSREKSAFKDTLVQTLAKTRTVLDQMIGNIETPDITSSKRRRILEGIKPFMESLRRDVLKYVLGRELTNQEAVLLQNNEVNQKILKVLSILATLSVVDFYERTLARRVVADFLNVLFLAYDPSTEKDTLENAKAKLSAFMMDFDNKNLTNANGGQQQLDRSNREMVEDLVSAGYSRDLWTRGIEFEIGVSQGITEEGKRESIRQASFEMVETALALGVKEVNGREISLEMAKEVDNYEKAKAFANGLKALKITIPEDRSDRLKDILHYIEAKEGEPVIAAQEESKFRVTIKKDFLNEATAGLGVPGCFNPNGIHREMPLVHAMEVNAGFIQVYNESGRQVANAVVVYGKEGAYVYPGYNASSYNMDFVFGRALAQLTKYVPRLVLDGTSAGRTYLSKYGNAADQPVTLIKPATIFKDQYYDSGSVDEQGQLTLNISNPLIVTKGDIEAKRGFDVFEPKSIEQPQQKIEALAREEINFQELADIFIQNRFKKYLFMVSLLKKKIMQEGKTAIDDDFYMWVNARVKEKLKSDEVNIFETDRITDLMVDFLEKQKWPMEILTAVGRDAAMAVKVPGGIDFKSDKVNSAQLSAAAQSPQDQAMAAIDFQNIPDLPQRTGIAEVAAWSLASKIIHKRKDEGRGIDTKYFVDEQEGKDYIRNFLIQEGAEAYADKVLSLLKFNTSSKGYRFVALREEISPKANVFLQLMRDEVEAYDPKSIARSMSGEYMPDLFLDTKKREEIARLIADKIFFMKLTGDATWKWEEGEKEDLMKAIRSKVEQVMLFVDTIFHKATVERNTFAGLQNGMVIFDWLTNPTDGYVDSEGNLTGEDYYRVSHDLDGTFDASKFSGNSPYGGSIEEQLISQGILERIPSGFVRLKQDIDPQQAEQTIRRVAGNEIFDLLKRPLYASRFRDAKEVIVRILRASRMDYEEIVFKDNAMSTHSPKGGIDFKSDKVDSAFAVKSNGGEGIKFHVDPAMLEQLQNAAGFTPVIIDFQKLKSLPEFLGLNDPSPTSFQLAVASP